MSHPDLVKLIRRSFRERTLSAFFMVGVLSALAILVILGAALFYFRGEIFEYFAKEYFFSQALLSDEEKAESNIAEKIIEKESIFTQEYFIVDAVKKTKPAVVSIVISKKVPKYEVYINPEDKNTFEELFPGFPFTPTPELRQNGTEEKQVGGGSGFFVSSEGLIVTNKHVVEDTTAIYSVYTNDGKKHPATVVARDPLLDIALLKITSATQYPYLNLGNSDTLSPGQTVIAIGNALGEFKNTVSVGVISGLSRTLSAGGASGRAELLDHVIQTDAAINLGNSGGPLLDLSGRVIGVNVAVVTGSQGIGFALPINSVKGAIESVKTTGKIVRPYLGVRYIAINAETKEANNLAVDYGVWIKSGSGTANPAIAPGSPADKAGILEGDIILSVDGVKITDDTSFASIIRQKKVGQVVSLRILRAGAEKTIRATLEAYKEN